MLSCEGYAEGLGYTSRRSRSSLLIPHIYIICTSPYHPSPHYVNPLYHSPSLLTPFIPPLPLLIRFIPPLLLQVSSPAYRREVQRLATKGKLAVVVSDDSLAFGVNMPFRTCVFTGQMNGELTPLMAQQMSGRAGRRGLDTQGNLVYVGAPASFIRSLMIGKVSNITGAGHAPRYETCFLQGMLSTRYVRVFMDYPTVSSLAYRLPPHAYCLLLLLTYLPVNTSYQQSPIIAHTYLLLPSSLTISLPFPSTFFPFLSPFPPLLLGMWDGGELR